MVLSDKWGGASVLSALMMVIACSNDAPEEDGALKHDAAAACEHINEVCVSVEGFEGQDCSSSNADYDKLSPTDKAVADSIAPCVMASKSCQSALTCMRSASGPAATAKERARPEYEAEEACEHINDVCEEEAGFRRNDCSSSNADYEDLSDSDKELADSVAACIMKAKSCEGAFACLPR